MDKGDLDRLRHIKVYCEDIADAVKFLENSYDAFLTNIHYANSISMSILQIGELSVGLTEDFKDSTREQMPWGLIRGMRNRFAHIYSSMNRNEIWETATKDIPVLLRFCENIIEKAM